VPPADAAPDVRHANRLRGGRSSSQALALVAMAISLAFQFAAQARVFTLLPFQFGNQFFA
jgi:hypothetical protein